MRYRCTPDPADAIQWFKKDQIGVWNWERWTTPEFETLWTKGLAETDRTKRNAIYVRMQEIMENTGAYVWITFDPWSYASVNEVESCLRVRRRDARRALHEGLGSAKRAFVASVLPLPPPGHFIPGGEAGERRSGC